MRLVTVRAPRGAVAAPGENDRLAVLLDDRVLPLAALAEVAPSRLPAEIDRFDLPALLAQGDRLGAIRDALETADKAALDASTLRLDEVTLGPPIPRPGKIVCVGQNYMDHIREQGIEPPKRPILFAKFANAVIGPGDRIVTPPGTHALDLEAELVVVIGRRASRVPAASAMDVVAGYTVGNDVSARDWQGQKSALRPGERGDGQWLRAKGSDTFLPLGPAFVTADEVDPGNLRIRSWRIAAEGPHAGEEFRMQNGVTSDMIWNISELIEFISAAIALEPGDLVMTGTPNGVGAFRDPPIWLKPGDLVRVEVEGIGTLENPVTDEQGDAPEGSPAADALAASARSGAIR